MAKDKDDPKAAEKPPLAGGMQQARGGHHHEATHAPRAGAVPGVPGPGTGPAGDERAAFAKFSEGLRMAADACDELCGHRPRGLMGAAPPASRALARPPKPFTEGEGSKRYIVSLTDGLTLVGRAESEDEAWRLYGREVGVVRTTKPYSVTEAPADVPEGVQGSLNPYDRSKADRGEQPGEV
jgi:hypothetical protein